MPLASWKNPKNFKKIVGKVNKNSVLKGVVLGVAVIIIKLPICISAARKVDTIVLT